MDLIAKKPMTYATRRLQAGEPFTASPANARVLIAIGKAHRATGVKPKAETKVEVKAPTPAADLDTLRAEYLSVAGKRPFNGWNAATLAGKIAAARAAG